MSRSACGTCTLCCTVMKVDMDPPKPEHQTCIHCTGRGCGIYADRPDPCVGFKCLWLASQETPRFALSAAMRPDRVGVVIDLNEAMTVIAHCERPGSWKREPMRSWLLLQAKRTNVILEMPGRVELLARDGTVEELVRTGVDPVTNNRLYVRASEAHRLNKRDAA